MKIITKMYKKLLRFLSDPRLRLWTFMQPLTKTPINETSVISDLFVWRCSPEWETYFEVVDIYSVFGDSGESLGRFLTIIFYDSKGGVINKIELPLTPKERNTIALKQYLSHTKDTYGTFCVFHSHTPVAVTKLGSFIAERGYVSYRFNKSPIRSFVHGNLDAISYSNNKTELLGTVSLMKREYRLQYELSKGSLYEVAIVNPSKKSLSITCMVITDKGELYKNMSISLPSKGANVFSIEINDNGSYKVVIKSKLIMARPLVFSHNEFQFDVFHG